VGKLEGRRPNGRDYHKLEESTKDIWKVKIQSPENICEAFFYSLVAFLQHTFIYFSTYSPWIKMHLVSLGTSFFYSSVVEISAYSLSHVIARKSLSSQTFLQFRKQVIVTWCKVWAVWWMG
jgi:hypothetical protein